MKRFVPHLVYLISASALSFFLSLPTQVQAEECVVAPGQNSAYQAACAALTKAYCKSQLECEWHTDCDVAAGSNPAHQASCQVLEKTDCDAQLECVWNGAGGPVGGPGSGGGVPNVPPTTGGSASTTSSTPSSDPTNGDTSKQIIKLQNPLTTNSITEIAGRAIQAAMGIMGSLALVVFIYGGFRWLTAGGNSESVSAGTGAMVWATIGIFIIFASYAILQLVFSAIGAKGGSGTAPGGGSGGDYCLVSCTAASSCEDISKAAGEDFATLDKKCTENSYSIEKKKCSQVEVCMK